MEEFSIGVAVGAGSMAALRLLWQRVRYIRSQRRQRPSNPPYDPSIDEIGESGLERWTEYRRRNA